MNFRPKQKVRRRQSTNLMSLGNRWKSTRSIVNPKSFRKNQRATAKSEAQNLDFISHDDFDWKEEFFSVSKEKDADSEGDIGIILSTKQTYILATLVPDEIINVDHLKFNHLRRFIGVLLLVDVSGFTALSERYQNTGKGGTYRLTATLNAYLGALIEVIYGHGGDVIKFAGDAFLALWKPEKGAYFSHTIHNVISCALLIQHTFGVYETDVKVNLKVKLGISAGTLIFTTIGSGVDKNFCIIGQPVYEAKEAEGKCTSGDVMVAPTAWGHCYSRNYDFSIRDGNFIKVVSILYDPRETNVTKPFAGFTAARHLNKPMLGVEDVPEEAWYSSLSVNEERRRAIADTVLLRPVVLVTEEKGIGEQLRNFMIRPLLQQIDAHQPLEYLAEMRQVTIMFITLKPKDCSYVQMISIVDNAYRITCKIVYKSMGCVNKIILFDKDVMILVIFGLRGFKHESEAQTALKSAYSVKKSIVNFEDIQHVSVGITTGQVYCGVVGHPLRREFSVIGAPVNKAARMMCAFRGQVTCDEETYSKSKLSANCFALQPKIELKGINDSGKIYEYSENIRAKRICNIEMILPLLNRSDEMEYFTYLLEDARKLQMEYSGLLLIGESRIGKTRLLEYMIRDALNEHVTVASVALTALHSASPYSSINQIVNQLLSIRDDGLEFAKEDQIVQMLGKYDANLCYLNGVLRVRFAYSDAFHCEEAELRLTKAKAVFEKLIRALPKTVVIALDDLQNLDSHSWPFLSVILDCKKTLVVMTLMRGRFGAISDWLYGVFIDDNVRKVRISTLDFNWLPPLACQVLDVVAVPRDLCEVLKKTSRGNPGVVESYLINLFSNDYISVESVLRDEVAESYAQEDLIFPNSVHLLPHAVLKSEQAQLELALVESPTVNVCRVLRPDELIGSGALASSDAAVMTQIDALTPYQQLMLKIASVVGEVFTRELLAAVMLNADEALTARAVKRLFEARLFTCARHDRSQSFVFSAYLVKSQDTFSCECDVDPELYESSKYPKYAFCGYIRFKNKKVRQTCYELLPTNQKREFHARVVRYLERTSPRCPACGGELVIAQSASALAAMHVPAEDSSSDHEDDDVVQAKAIARSCSTVMERQSENLYESTSDEDESNLWVKERVEGGSQMNGATKDSPPACDGDEREHLIERAGDVARAENADDWRALGVSFAEHDIAERGVSFTFILSDDAARVDFERCTCNELATYFYEQLTHHATGAEMRDRVVASLVECAAACLTAADPTRALVRLDEAEVVIERARRTDGSLGVSDFDERILVGRILTLKARAHASLADYDSAKLCAARATAQYRRAVGRFALLKRVMRRHLSARHLRVAEALLECLNVMTALHSQCGELRAARAAARGAVAAAEAVRCRPIAACAAYAHLIYLVLDAGECDAAAEVERRALCALRGRRVLAQELLAVGALLTAALDARLARGDLAGAARVGCRALAVARRARADAVASQIVPDLFYALLARGRSREAAELTLALLRLAVERRDLEYECWYYALCMDLLLDAGLQVEPAASAQRFAEQALVGRAGGGAARRRLVVNLWTYWQRVEDDERLASWEAEVRCAAPPADMTALLSALRATEGALEWLARKLDDVRRLVHLSSFQSLAERELTELEPATRRWRSARARWSLLRGQVAALTRGAAPTSGLHALAADNAVEQARAGALVAAARADGGERARAWVEAARAGRLPDWRDERAAWHGFLYTPRMPHDRLVHFRS